MVPIDDALTTTITTTAVRETTTTTPQATMKTRLTTTWKGAAAHLSGAVYESYDARADSVVEAAPLDNPNATPMERRNGSGVEAAVSPTPEKEDSRDSHSLARDGIHLGLVTSNGSGESERFAHQPVVREAFKMIKITQIEFVKCKSQL